MRAPAIFLLLLTASACATPTPPPPPAPEVEAPPPAPPARRLVLLHLGDSESELLPNPLPGSATGTFGGIARVAGILDGLATTAGAPVLRVGAGDLMLPSPLLHVDIDGKNAVALATAELRLQASALGNHEFDLGDGFLAERIALQKFPYVTANVDFTTEPLAPLWLPPEKSGGTVWAERTPGRIVPRAKACAGRLIDEPGGPRCEGLTVGLVGCTTELLRSITSASTGVKVTPTLELLVQRVQAQVDALQAEGLDVIVLLSHLQGVEKELALVDLGLTGVDVIVAGGGDDRLANLDHRLLPGETPDPSCIPSATNACYPLRRTAKDGAPVLVVAVDGHYRYVGRLGLSLDERGRPFDVDASSRPWPVDDPSLAESGGRLSTAGVVLEGKVGDYLRPLELPFARVLHWLEGQREAVRNRQTNLGDLSADSMLWAARAKLHGRVRPAFALRNGGGIRAPIGSIVRETGARLGGPLSMLEVQASLRFDNGLVVVRTTHERLLETLEASLRGAGTGRGRFPQVSRGVRIEYDAARPEQLQEISPDGAVKGVKAKGERVRRLVVPDEKGRPITIVEEGRLLRPKAELTFVTIGYLAKGGDGWFPPSPLQATVTPIDASEQRALREYVLARVADGSWADGAEYVDPVPGNPQSFTRILELPR